MKGLKVNTRAVSVLELVLAFSLLGLLFLFVLNLLPTTGLVERRAQHQSAAANYAREINDFCATRDFGMLADGTYDDANRGPFGDLLAARTLDDTVVLSATVVIEPVNPIPRNRLLRARITVSWPERGGDRSVTTERRVSAVLK